MKFEKQAAGKDKTTIRVSLKWGEKIDSAELSKLQNKNISGLLLPTVKRGWFTSKLEGTVTNSYVAADYLAETHTADEFLDLFWRLLQCLESVQSAGLDANKLLLEKEYVFIQKNTDTVKMFYLPVQETVGNVFGFLAEFVDSANVTDDKNGMMKALVDSIYSNQSQDFKQIIEEVNRQRALITEQNTVKEPERVVDENYDLEEGTVLVFKTKKSYGYFECEALHDSFTVMKPSFMVGRSESADHVIPGNTAVSHIHAEIIKENDRYFLQDQYSTNGTSVNGEKVDPSERVEIFNGNVICFADVEYKFSVRWK